MVKFKECIEDITIPEDWKDVSYGNDEAPSWTHNGYQIHINHRNFIERKDAFRYYNSVDDGKHELATSIHELYSWSKCFDDLGQVLNFIKTPFISRAKFVKSLQTNSYKISVSDEGWE
tara:strand:+ start:142 stop:495 length:354 start_codon:yes stop_codon:yes gene_type:complete